MKTTVYLPQWSLDKEVLVKITENVKTIAALPPLEPSAAMKRVYGGESLAPTDREIRIRGIDYPFQYIIHDYTTVNSGDSPAEKTRVMVGSRVVDNSELVEKVQAAEANLR